MPGGVTIKAAAKVSVTGTVLLHMGWCTRSQNVAHRGLQGGPLRGQVHAGGA